jgi:hypothetical protein
MSQPSDGDLRAELAEVHRRLAKLEAKAQAGHDGAARPRRHPFASKFVPSAFPAALLMGLATGLYGASTGNALFIAPNGDVRIGAKLEVSGDVTVGEKVHAKAFEGGTASVKSLTLNNADVATEIAALKTNSAAMTSVLAEKAQKGGSRDQKFEASEINVAGSISAKPNWDSGWVADNSDSHHKKSFLHSLKALPAQVTIYFSPNADQGPFYLVGYDWAPAESGNPVTVEVTENEIILHIVHGWPLRGLIVPGTTEWSRWTSGYWRVIVFGGVQKTP